MSRFLRFNSYLLFLSLMITGLSSCVSTKNITYFKDVPDSVKYKEIVPAQFTAPIIQPDDILAINIQTIDPQSTAALNQVATMPTLAANTATGGNQQTVPGFLVDKNGNVFIPMIGQLKLSGLTTLQAREIIQSKASQFFKEPNVQVRFANYKVTVIGEVARPATYTVPNEKVTLLDAIGLAGDLTITGKRENVLLIRDTEGKKEFVRFNLNSSDIFRSPFFYLKQNDVVYVEPSKAKAALNNAARTQTFAIIASGLTVLIALITRL